MELRIGNEIYCNELCDEQMLVDVYQEIL